MPSADMLPPLPPPLRSAPVPLQRMRALLGWGFGASIAFHAILAPVAGAYKPPIAEAPEITMVSISKRTTIKIPTPVPTPQPTKPPTPPPDRPSPPPSPIAAPVSVHSAMPQARLKIDVPKNTSKAGSSAEPKYNVERGSQEGVPQGTLASAPPSGAGAIPSVLPSESSAAPARTAKANCAVPNVGATTSRAAEPDYPESARESGTTGEVEVLVSLSAAGVPTAAVINKSSGNAALDAAAIRAARESFYLPEIVACQAVNGTYLFLASFTAK